MTFENFTQTKHDNPDTVVLALIFEFVEIINDTVFTYLKGKLLLIM